MGGQGKTQIALHYCFKRKDSPYKVVFWIDATSQASLESGFVTLFDAVKPSDLALTDSQAKIDFVLEYFSELSDPWLLVCDNYDKLDYRIQDFFPQGGNGSILITSRHAATRELVNDDDAYIELQGLGREPALDLLYNLTRIARSESANKAADVILERLGYHALAITQAAAYIKKQRIDFVSFLKDYKSRREIILRTTPALTEYRRKLSTSEKETALNVFTTWQLSFQQLHDETKDETGAEGPEIKLLTLFAFFDNQGISELLFSTCEARFHIADEDAFSQESKILIEWLVAFKVDGEWDTRAYGDAVNALIESSLVQSSERREDNLLNVTIHPLVKDWIRLQASATSCQINTITAWLLIGSALFESFDWERDEFTLALPARQEMVRHIQVQVANQEEFFTKDSSSIAKPVELDLHKAHYWCGLLMFRAGQYASAELILRSGMEFFESHLGSADRWTRNSMAQLVDCLCELEKYDEALIIQQAHLEATTKQYGSDHWYTFDSARGVAGILRRLNRPEEVEASLVDLLSKSETVLGSNHITTLQICNELAAVFYERGEHAKAEELYRKSYRGCFELYGLENRETLESLGNLARVTGDLGDYEHALEMYAQALQGFENVHGPEHPRTIYCRIMRDTALKRKELRPLVDLAKGAVEREDYDEALEIWDQAVQKSESLFGPNDKWSVWCRERKTSVPVKKELRLLDDLIEAAKNQRNYDQSLEIYDQAIHKCENAWGSDDLRTLEYKDEREIISYVKLAEAAVDREDYDQAIDMFDQAIRLCEAAFDADDPWISSYKERRGTIEKAQKVFSARKKRKESTLEMYDEALNGFEVLFATGEGDTTWCETNDTGENTQEITL